LIGIGIGIKYGTKIFFGTDGTDSARFSQIFFVLRFENQKKSVKIR
jgi:hypothetical protein